MKTWLPSLALLASLTGAAWGTEVQLNQDALNRQRCSGMYSQKAWGGPIESFILVKFAQVEDAEASDPVTSLLIFEWQDREFIGQQPASADADAALEVICNQPNVNLGLCRQEDLGSFILEANSSLSKNPLFTQAVHLKDPPAIKYPVKRTGYYCISTYAFSEHEYEAVAAFRNAYGELPATQIAKLPFYGGLTITYAVLGIFWAFLYIQNRSDILPVQNYITATLIFLVIEQLITWLFYDYQNRHGDNTVNKILLVIVSILNAGRNSLSFFLLLIVCMGFGVVKPTLGRTMIYVRILAIVHFIFGVVYAVASLSVTPENVGPIVLFVILPLAGTLTAFYVWTLSSLNLTMKDLIDRKQKTKALMYKRLWCVAFAGSSEENFVPQHWQTRWFVLDGWLNIVYLFDIAFVAYLWRPTANNRRFAMSEELAQDDDGFEIRSIHSRDSLDDLSDINDVEAAAAKAAEDRADSASNGAPSHPTNTSGTNTSQANSKETGAASVGTHEIRRRRLCSDCFIRYVHSKVFKRMDTFRFKNSTGNDARIRRRLLLPLSGGVSSLALLNALDTQLKGQREKQNRTAYDLVLVHIDMEDSGEENGQRGLAFRLEQDLARLGLGRTQQGQSDRELYSSVMAAASTPTARSDLEQVLLKRVVVSLAKKQTCEGVLWGHSDSRLAALALADTELELYARVLPEPLDGVLAPEMGSGGGSAAPPLLAIRNTSIDSLLSTYIMSQGDKYPSIMANVDIKIPG
ncbi:hypothetical protein DV735_g3766, partial [Chaetothyriales sp. CBS 134920]